MVTSNPHWAEGYIGRPYIEGRHDCADFVAAVLRERFGREIALPGRAGNVRARDAQIVAMKGAYARRVAPEARGDLGAPREGDGVLMAAAGRGRCMGHHIGIWCAPGGVPHVLHCLKGVGSILHPLRDLGRRALVLEGVYRWL